MSYLTDTEFNTRFCLHLTIHLVHTVNSFNTLFYIERKEILIYFEF